MKILMIAPGHSIHSKRPLIWLLENGFDVTFVDSTNPYPEGRDRYQFIPYPIPRGRRYYKMVGERIASWLSLWTIVIQLRVLWHRVRPDITHVHWVDRRAYHCVKAGLRPLVLSAWGTDINRHFLPDANPENCRIIGQTLAYADRVIVETPFMAERCDLLAGREVNTEVLVLGVNTKLFQPGYDRAAIEWRRKLAVPTDSRVLLSPRGWAKLYGHHLILEAFSQARPRLKANAVLAFIVYNRSSYSESIAYKAELRRRVEELGIAQWVRWIDEVPMARLPEIYAFADVIINFPAMDSFPFTFLEAAACKRPVISCRLPSYRDTFAERYFRMVELGSIVELADAIVEEVNKDPAQRTRFLSEARRVVEREYDESIYIKRLLNIYRKLV